MRNGEEAPALDAQSERTRSRAGAGAIQEYTTRHQISLEDEPVLPLTLAETLQFFEENQRMAQAGLDELNRRLAECARVPRRERRRKEK